MVKSTVRFSEAVIDRIDELVEDGVFSNKSEFQRFATELLLTEIEDYEPEMLDFEELRDEALPSGAVIGHGNRQDNPSEFFRTATRVRQFAVRGDIAAATEVIDTQYPPSDPRCMILDDILDTYRQDGRTEHRYAEFQREQSGSYEPTTNHESYSE